MNLVTQHKLKNGPYSQWNPSTHCSYIFNLYCQNSKIIFQPPLSIPTLKWQYPNTWSPKKTPNLQSHSICNHHAIFGLPDLWAIRGAFLITYHKKLSQYYPTGICLPTLSPNWRLSPGKSVRDYKQSLQTPWTPGVINHHNHPQVSWGSVWPFASVTKTNKCPLHQQHKIWEAMSLQTLQNSQW